MGDSSKNINSFLFRNTGKSQFEKEDPTLKHHQALDDASKSFGHPNFKNYKNDAKAYDSWLSAALEAGADAAMDEQAEKMAAKFNLVDPLFQNFKVPIQDLISTFKKKKHSDEEVQSICEKESTLKEYLELFFLKDCLDDIDWDLVTHAPYHVPHQATVKNLNYKYGKNNFDEPTDSELLYVEGEYDIVCQTMFDHTQEDKDAVVDGFFDNCTLTGTFELTIDKDKNIILGDSDIGLI